jgi:hypothetical protein
MSCMPRHVLLSTSATPDAGLATRAWRVILCAADAAPTDVIAGLRQLGSPVVVYGPGAEALRGMLAQYGIVVLDAVTA